MSFVPGNAHDVFVSYAHVDDRPVPGADRGWVSTLVEGLKTLLAQKLGRDEARLWMDPQLAGNAPITEEIMEVLARSATLLMIFSPGYLASEWCQRERNAFLDNVRRRFHSSSQLFVVEHNKAERPKEIRGSKGYRFWVEEATGGVPRILGWPRPNPNDPRYYDRLTDLSEDLAQELRRLRTEAERPGTGTTVAESAPAVFLAEVTDDLDPLRYEVRRHLDQAGLRVVPEGPLSLDPKAFRESVDAELAESVLFAQLLSEVPGKRPPDMPEGYVRMQLERARAAGKPILQWHRPELDRDSVADDSHRELLGGETVLAIGLEEFKRTVRERAVEKPEPPAPRPLNTFVFVDMEAADRSQARAVCEVLQRHGADYALPAMRGTPAEVRRDLEHHLVECDALIIVYGTSTAIWVREQLIQCRKVLARRERPLQALAVFQGPPGPKDPLDVHLANMQLIDCCEGDFEAALGAFLDRLGNEAKP
jgi:hypothetical protein